MSLIDELRAWVNKPSGQYLKVDSGSLINGVDYDTIDTTYPSATQEVYVFKLSAVVVQTVTVDYTDSVKNNLLKVTYS